MLSRKPLLKQCASRRLYSSLFNLNPKAPSYRVALCGAGPGGLATLRALGKRWTQKDPPPCPLQVDVFEASLVPLGLVRLGVAPDHPSIKAVGDSLVEGTARYKDLEDESFRFEFFGGVELGKFLQLRMLRKHYDAVILCTGITNVSGKREHPILGLSGEDAKGITSAEDVIEWYNGRSLAPPGHLYDIYRKVPGVMIELGQWTIDSHLLDYSLARSTSATSDQGGITSVAARSFGRFFDPTNVADRVVVIGQGNVAADIVRIFLRDPETIDCRHLPPAGRRLLHQLHGKYIRDFQIMGRRGFLQANWNIATLRELFSVNDKALVLVKPEEYKASLEVAACAREVKRDRQAQRMATLIEQGVANYERLVAEAEKDHTGRPRLDAVERSPDAVNVWLRFCTQPTKFHTEGPRMEESVTAVEVAQTKLFMPKGGKSTRDILASPPEDDAPRELLDRIRLVVKCLGYGTLGRAKPRAWEGFYDPEALDAPKRRDFAPNANLVAEREPGQAPVYAAGWVRSGGKGSLADTIVDAGRTADQVITDLTSGLDPKGVHRDADRMTLTLVVPELGIPISWEESMHILQWEATTGEKITEWKKAADLVNKTRLASNTGPRGVDWQRVVQAEEDAMAATGEQSLRSPPH